MDAKHDKHPMKKEEKPTLKVVDKPSQSTSADAKPTRKQRAPGEKKTDNKFVAAWKAQPKFPPEAKLTILVEHTATGPKRDTTRSKANTRYSYYKGCKTVQDYLDVCKKHNIPAPLTNADLRWDHVHGFIKVEGGNPPVTKE